MELKYLYKYFKYPYCINRVKYVIPTRGAPTPNGDFSLFFHEIEKKMNWGHAHLWHPPPPGSANEYKHICV